MSFDHYNIAGLHSIRRHIYMAIVTLIAYGLPLGVFAQEAPYNKTQELTLFLAKHEKDIQGTKTQEDKLFETEGSQQVLSIMLDDKEMPVMLQAYLFLLSMSPEFWTDITKAEEIAQINLKILKHSNPIVRLHGMASLQEFKEQLKKPKEWQTEDDISTMKQVIDLVETQYSSPTQDQILFKQYQKCYAYIKPILASQQNEAIDVQAFTTAFETANPDVQFYLTFQISLGYMWAEDKQAEQILKQILNKGDNFSRALALTSLGDNEQINRLLKNTIDPDEFITIGSFLDSRNIEIPPEAWPDKERLQAFFSKASLSTQQKLLELMKKTIELN